jgi:hypothetical protein
MNKNERIWIILISLIVVAILTALWASSTFFYIPEPWRHHAPPLYEIPEDIEFFYTAKAVISTINVTLSLFLLITYISIYRKTRSEFTIGLIIFSAVFLLNALASSPIVIWAFGFQPFGLGPFAFLPDMFTLGALVVLLYLSVKY